MGKLKRKVDEIVYDRMEASPSKLHTGQQPNTASQAGSSSLSTTITSNQASPTTAPIASAAGPSQPQQSNKKLVATSRWTFEQKHADDDAKRQKVEMEDIVANYGRGKRMRNPKIFGDEDVKLMTQRRMIEQRKDLKGKIRAVDTAATPASSSSSTSKLTNFDVFTAGPRAAHFDLPVANPSSNTGPTPMDIDYSPTTETDDEVAHLSTTSAPKLKRSGPVTSTIEGAHTHTVWPAGSFDQDKDEEARVAKKKKDAKRDDVQQPKQAPKRRSGRKGPRWTKKSNGKKKDQQPLVLGAGLQFPTTSAPAAPETFTKKRKPSPAPFQPLDLDPNDPFYTDDETPKPDGSSSPGVGLNLSHIRSERRVRKPRHPNPDADADAEQTPAMVQQSALVPTNPEKPIDPSIHELTGSTFLRACWLAQLGMSVQRHFQIPYDTPINEDLLTSFGRNASFAPPVSLSSSTTTTTEEADDEINVSGRSTTITEDVGALPATASEEVNTQPGPVTAVIETEVDTSGLSDEDIQAANTLAFMFGGNSGN
ncbi:hypothetical protein HK097_001974 [Rhizophlyctis rosea]|uniref:Uncharacterized protein n=1 Tax=Rhizophlyctis rosea TaxID=64517 RepID=A0AAD5X0H3_9FUNG|nr:hypothetical protein HK097_001974 [Rhizophlyctis rosea]